MVKRIALAATVAAGALAVAGPAAAATDPGATVFTANGCAACHTPPKDNFHRGVVPTCSQCHSTTAWKPATFDHDRYFSLRPPHDATCSTCHVGGNVQTYTCFGCHEHQKARIEARHAREGIRNIDNCVRCHRSAEGEGGEGQGREGREGRD